MLAIGTRVFVMPLKSYATIVGYHENYYVMDTKHIWRRKYLITREDASRILDELTKPEIRIDTPYHHKFDSNFTATVKFILNGHIFYVNNLGQPGAHTEADFRRAYDVQ